jgi:hypothetical protein
MKTRTGFVSNSSSSSFVINKDDISERQIELIIDHIMYGKKFGVEYCEKHDEWKIKETEFTIEGDTSMDNFDMEHYLDEIGVSSEHIKWDRY